MKENQHMEEKEKPQKHFKFNKSHQKKISFSVENKNLLIRSDMNNNNIKSEFAENISSNNSSTVETKNINQFNISNVIDVENESNQNIISNLQLKLISNERGFIFL